MRRLRQRRTDVGVRERPAGVNQGGCRVPREQGRATIVGTVAVLMWATLALLTAQSGQVPPFLLVASPSHWRSSSGWRSGYGAPATSGRVWRASRSQFRLPLRVWALGVGGLFGYHFFYFLALRSAPPVEASLIAYLWPLLIVVFSAFLPAERLRWWHVAGTLAGLLGTAILVTGGEVSFKSQFAPGYAAAAVCALLWSGYSVLSRTVRQVPSTAVGAFCGVTAILSFGAHFSLETTVWPADTGEWLAVLGLGLGPCRHCLLSLGSWRQARRNSCSRRGLLWRPAAFHNPLDRGGVGRGHVAGWACVYSDYGRRVVGGTGTTESPRGRSRVIA